VDIRERDRESLIVSILAVRGLEEVALASLQKLDARRILDRRGGRAEARAHAVDVGFELTMAHRDRDPAFDLRPELRPHEGIGRERMERARGPREIVDVLERGHEAKRLERPVVPELVGQRATNETLLGLESRSIHRGRERERMAEHGETCLEPLGVLAERVGPAA
jgi:hypothetical protein